jgi:ABC-type multidrug transport system ATPase subunit
MVTFWSETTLWLVLVMAHARSMCEFIHTLWHKRGCAVLVNMRGAVIQVNAAIEDMGLRHIRNSRIGGTVIKGISGGEMRRVSVAIQLLQDPGIWHLK